MANIASSALDLVGRTPLVEVNNIATARQLQARLLVKVEAFNPGSSVKDRIAKAMIEDAEAKGVLTSGSVIIEASSGNTGVGLSLVAAVKGYRAIVVMPETMSIERRRIVSAFGAEVVLTPGAQGMKGAIAKAEELRQSTPDGVILQQFENAANPAIHAATTAEEVWADTDGAVDIFVAGVGTGGTVSGTGRVLKARKPEVQIVAVEPADSPVLSGGNPSPHKIQGIGAGFVPQTYDPAVIDTILQVTNDQAFAAARLLAAREGLLVGISSGAAFEAALRLAEQPENKGKTIVALLPDTGERYLSTALFE